LPPTRASQSGFTLMCRSCRRRQRLRPRRAGDEQISRPRGVCVTSRRPSRDRASRSPRGTQ
jgi:hypothetical protein